MRFFLATIALATTGPLFASAHPPNHPYSPGTNIDHTHSHTHTHSGIESFGAHPTGDGAAMTSVNPDKRDNPVYFNLECRGDDLSVRARKCNDSDLNGDWCSKNCECTWTGCMKCKGLKGCSDAVVVTTCAAATSKWDCNCVGFGPKEGDVGTCAVIP